MELVMVEGEFEDAVLLLMTELTTLVIAEPTYSMT